jgi:hypothetical protein
MSAFSRNKTRARRTGRWAAHWRAQPRCVPPPPSPRPSRRRRPWGGASAVTSPTAYTPSVPVASVLASTEMKPALPAGDGRHGSFPPRSLTRHCPGAARLEALTRGRLMSLGLSGLPVGGDFCPQGDETHPLRGSSRAPNLGEWLLFHLGFPRCRGGLDPRLDRGCSWRGAELSLPATYWAVRRSSWRAPGWPRWASPPEPRQSHPCRCTWLWSLVRCGSPCEWLGSRPTRCRRSGSRRGP